MLVVDNLCCTKGELCKSGVVPTGGCVNGGFPVELTRGESVTDMTTTSSPQCLCQKKKTYAPHMSEVEIPSVMA